MPVTNNHIIKNHIMFHNKKSGGSISIKRPDRFEANVAPVSGLSGVGTSQSYNQAIKPTGVSGPINITGHGIVHGLDKLSFASKKKKTPSNVKFTIK